MERYCSIFIDKIRIGINRKDNFEMPLTGMKIVVDAGNGAGGFFAHNILKPLGADIEGSVFLEPDGMFPNHEPNPENSEAMESIRSAVLKSGADLGIIFDTDVDRSAIVDSSGVIINRNSLIALISAIVLEEHPGTTIVTDSVTSEGLRIFIEDKLGGRHHRFKRGYKNVINEAVRLNNEGEECHLAIETSGHGAMKENYFLDDGAYLAARLIIESARLKLENKGSILYLIKDLVQPVEEVEFRINLYEDDFASQGKMIINDLERFVNGVDAWTIAPVNYEGIRVSCGRSAGDGWFLLRLSLHDPVLPLNIESDSPGGAALIAGELVEFLNNYKNISFEKLQKYISG
jgi:phosphomannomutase